MRSIWLPGGRSGEKGLETRYLEEGKEKKGCSRIERCSSGRVRWGWTIPVTPVEKRRKLQKLESLEEGGRHGEEPGEKPRDKKKIAHQRRGGGGQS